MNEYHSVSGTIDDVLRERSKVSQLHSKWILNNTLPFTINVYLNKAWSNYHKVFTTLKSHEKKEFNANLLQEKDVLYATHKNYEGKEVPLMESYEIKGYWKNICFGIVKYTSEIGTRYHVSHADIGGVWLHNRMQIPLEIHYKGNLVAQICENDGLNYLGGSASSVYFDNSREGLRFMDELTIYSSLHKKKLYTIKLVDNHMDNIYIGLINGSVDRPRNDTYAHSIDKPVYTGLSYYKPTGRYNSLKV